MQRHFSNRGGALTEVAATKMMAHRTPPIKSVFPNQRRRSVTPGQWKPRVAEAVHPTGSPKERVARELKSDIGPLKSLSLPTQMGGFHELSI